jgi:NADPH:quinone reductase-like Zn-dependent oxidoreductase
MRAIAHSTYGPPEIVELREVEKPLPKDDEMLVRVHAASVNRSDWEALTGTPLYARMNGLRTPRLQILGSDVAGTVEAVGRLHTHFKPGDEVVGEMENYAGGFADFVCSRGRDWVLKPPGLTFEQAAAIPQAAVIALQGLRDRGAVRRGESVLINGAGGGAGTFAVQLAKAYGAEVTAVDHGSKLEFLRSIGADHGIDYTAQDFTSTGRTYDVILDVIADRGAIAYARALKRGGRYYAAGGSVATFMGMLFAGPWLSLARDKRVRVLAVRRNRKDLETVMAMCSSGELVPQIERTWELEDAAEALRWLGEGKARGKLVVRVRREGD